MIANSARNVYRPTTRTKKGFDSQKQRSRFTVTTKTGATLNDFMPVQYRTKGRRNGLQRQRAIVPPDPDPVSVEDSFPALSTNDVVRDAPMDWSQLTKVSAFDAILVDNMNKKAACAFAKTKMDTRQRTERVRLIKNLDKTREELRETNPDMDEDSLEDLLVTEAFDNNDEGYRMYVINSISKEHPKASEDDLARLFDEYQTKLKEEEEDNHVEYESEDSDSYYDILKGDNEYSPFYVYV